jgi:hypothetical protein
MAFERVRLKGFLLLAVQLPFSSFLRACSASQVYEMQAEYTVTFEGKKYYGNGIAEFGGNLVA